MKKEKVYWNYPYWTNKSKRAWKRDVRKRWVAMRKEIENVRFGAAYYPPEVTRFISSFREIDEIMRTWYKNS